jgi:hypothetical protein
MEVQLPPSYYLERDPDLIVLRRRREGCRVAAFSARGGTRKEIEKAAREDLRESLPLFVISTARVLFFGHLTHSNERCHDARPQLAPLPIDEQLYLGVREALKQRERFLIALWNLSPLEGSESRVVPAHLVPLYHGSPLRSCSGRGRY